MCLEEKELVRSHLIPAAIYEYCRGTSASPARVGEGKVRLTDRQTQAYLLCFACEGVLNRGGEMWTNGKLATIEQSFPLYDLLMNSRKSFEDAKGGIYFAAANPNFDFEGLAHFAMGIFWKASVHSWRGGEKAPLIELGSYSDPIRMWLLGETAFPKNTYLSVNLARPGGILVSMHEPVRSTFTEWHTFLLQVPGTLFILHIGKTIEADMRECCFYTNPGHPVFVSDDVTAEVNRRLASHYGESKKTKSYLKSVERRRNSQT